MLVIWDPVRNFNQLRSGDRIINTYIREFIANKTKKNTFQGNLFCNEDVCFQDITFENVVCQLSVFSTHHWITIKINLFTLREQMVVVHTCFIQHYMIYLIATHACVHIDGHSEMKTCISVSHHQIQTTSCSTKLARIPVYPTVCKIRILYPNSVNFVSLCMQNFSPDPISNTAGFLYNRMDIIITKRFCQ